MWFSIDSDETQKIVNGLKSLSGSLGFQSPT